MKLPTKNHNKHKKAFTLIELLVVIAIIGILATLAVAALQQTRSRARDSKRVADMKQIHTALELFFNENGRYPEENEFIFGEPLTSSLGGDILMQKIPNAPTPPDKDCNQQLNTYVYLIDDDNSDYSVNFCLGRGMGGLQKGLNTLKPGGFTTALSMTDADGNIYPAKKMPDGLVWTTTHLKTTRYRNKTKIATNLTAEEWKDQDGSPSKNGSYVIPIGFDINTYGALYNWYAVNTGLLCSEGWHIPSKEEIYGLISTTGGINMAGANLKSKRTEPDNHPRWDYKEESSGLNLYGFSVEAAGIVNRGGTMGKTGDLARIWTSTEYESNTSNAYAIPFWSHINSLGSENNFPKQAGYSVRCVKNY